MPLPADENRQHLSESLNKSDGLVKEDMMVSIINSYQQLGVNYLAQVLHEFLWKETTLCTVDEAYWDFQCLNHLPGDRYLVVRGHLGKDSRIQFELVSTVCRLQRMACNVINDIVIVAGLRRP